jgi:hypothetical protein
MPFPKTAKIYQLFYKFFLSGIMFHFIICKMQEKEVLCSLLTTVYQSTPWMETTITYPFSSHICRHLKYSKLNLLNLIICSWLTERSSALYYLALDSWSRKAVLHMPFVWDPETDWWQWQKHSRSSPIVQTQFQPCLCHICWNSIGHSTFYEKI